jgi:conjugative relaxase-like TrwC/TraI family protein
MLSISKAGGGYYANLAVDDYYTKGGEPPGHWYGPGAGIFGLSGQIDREQFLTLCEGFSLDGHKLVQNAGKDNRIAAHDMTFSAPKSVSTLWACADEWVRKEIQSAVWIAAKVGCDYIQDEAAYARRGDKERKSDLTDIEPATLTFALFEHGTSRAQDPQLHIHALALNFGIRADGTTASLESRVMHQHKMAAGAIFRAEFARELAERLGVEIIAGKKGTFEIKGVPKDLIEEFSKRRAEIEAGMKKDGVSGAAAAEWYTLTTREKKEHVAREILFQVWQEAGKRHGFDFQTAISATKGQELKREETRQDASELVEEAVHKITEGEAYFSKQDLVRKTAEFAALRGVRANEVREAVLDFIESGALVHLRTEDTKKIYTTHEIDQMEKRMLSQVEASRGKTFSSLTGEGGYLREGLSEEQKRAVYDITQRQGSIKVVSGMAGAGKTTMLNAAREIWEEQGYKVIGASLAAVAAKNLETEAGIKSATIAKLLYEIEQGRTPLSSKTMLVIDEAGMVGTRQMARLVDETEKKGARLILVGDERQLQPIEHGGPFKAIGEIVGRSELKEIRRQKDEWAREAVHAFADGRAEEGLRAYVERDLVTFQETRDEAIKTLVFDWKMDERPLEKKAIYATTKETVRELNREAQATRKERGELGETAIEVNGYEVYEGDRVLFTKNSGKIGVLNGDLGTVVKVNPVTDHIYIKLDRNDLVAVPLFNYRSVELGYARTTHKMQGKTVDSAYVLTGGAMLDREMSYVQMSRQRSDARLYFAVEESGREIQTIAAIMNRSRQKEIAQEKRPEYQHQQREHGIELSR